MITYTIKIFRDGLGLITERRYLLKKENSNEGLECGSLWYTSKGMGFAPVTLITRL